MRRAEPRRQEKQVKRVNEAWSKASNGTYYNLDALRRQARKRGGLIHLHAPDDECSKFEHERFEDGALAGEDADG